MQQPVSARGWLRTLGLSMTERMILALIVAPVVAGITYGAWLASSLSGIPDAYRPNLWSQAIPGVVVGAVFELFFLLPLLYFLRRVHFGGLIWFICLGTLGWYLLSLALLSFTQVDWSDCVATSLMFLAPGAALVVVFGTVAGSGGKA